MKKNTKNTNKKARHRKNFLPTLVITTFLWITLAAIVYFIEPGTFGAVPLFFTILFSAFLFTFSTIFANTRRGLITSISLILFLIISFFGIGNILNLILITALAITAEVYFIKQG